MCFTAVRISSFERIISLEPYLNRTCGGHAIFPPQATFGGVHPHTRPRTPPESLPVPSQKPVSLVASILTTVSKRMDQMAVQNLAEDKERFNRGRRAGFVFARVTRSRALAESIRNYALHRSDGEPAIVDAQGRSAVLSTSISRLCTATRISRTIEDIRNYTFCFYIGKYIFFSELNVVCNLSLAVDMAEF